MGANDKADVYQEISAVFEHPGTSDAVLFAGLASEVGEVLAEWLKEQREDRPHTDCTEELLEELSDVLWYVSRIAERRGSNLGALLRRSIIKLEERALNGK